MRGLHASSCHGVCALLKTCDMCTMYTSVQSSQTHSVLSGQGLSVSEESTSTPTERDAAGDGHRLPVSGHCVWCVKEAVCYHRDGTSLTAIEFY